MKMLSHLFDGNIKTKRKSDVSIMNIIYSCVDGSIHEKLASRMCSLTVFPFYVCIKWVREVYITATDEDWLKKCTINGSNSGSTRKKEFSWLDFFLLFLKKILLFHKENSYKC